MRASQLALLVSCWPLLVVNVLGTCCLNESQYLALYEFFDDLSGKDWYWLTPLSTYGNIWNFTTLNSSLNCPCTNNWQGLTCNALCEVSSISLSNYNLQGTLPSSLDQFTSLTALVLNNNSIRGPIVSSLTRMYSLTNIQLGINLLSGTIPDTFWNLTNLIYLNIPSNKLKGPLSPLIGKLTKLKNLFVYSLDLGGPIPDTLMQMVSLQRIRLSNNYHTGPFPQFLNRLPQLLQLNVAVNLLTQSLPVSICSMPVITNINIGTNLLTGSIPDCIGNLTTLTQNLLVSENLLEGSIPPTIGNLTNIYYLNFGANPLHGTIPDVFANLTVCNQLVVTNSFITGSIPESIQYLQRVNQIDFMYNLLHGTIPKEIGNITSMASFLLNNNLLSGTIPVTTQDMYNLSQLWLSNNMFSGPIVHMVNKSIQPYLTQIMVDNNRFTGSLPQELFGIPSLDLFVASINCLRGTISDAICSSELLSELALDGASSATLCQQSLFPQSFGFGTYAIKQSQQITGTIPICLYNMPNLHLLHLSGNGLTGSISDRVQVSSTLKILVLSHNQLTGNIPIAIQQHEWDTLDLSYNQFTGRITGFTNVTSNTSLTLAVNRLSGNIPSAVNSLKSINILQGNIFTCGYELQDLPPHDISYKNYQCGSNGFNVMIAIWLVFLVIVGFGGFLLVRYGEVKHGFDYVTAFSTQSLKTMAQKAEFEKIAKQLSLLRNGCLVLMMFNVLLLSLYGTLRSLYSEYEFLYAWTLSAMYLTGTTPGYCLFAVWFLLLVSLLVLYEYACHVFAAILIARQSTRAPPQPLQISERGEPPQFDSESFASNPMLNVPLTINHTIETSVTWTHRLYVILLFALNFCVVVGFNVSFVILSLYYNTSVIIAAQIGLAMFKFSWTRLLMNYFSKKHLRVPWSRQKVATIGQISDYYWLRTVVFIFNNIIIPVFSTTIVDVNCFYNAFVPASIVSYDFLIADTCSDYHCTDGTNCVCVTSYPNVITGSFVPSFMYSGQCSSTIVLIYIPVFTMLLLFDSLVVPIKTVLIVWWTKHRELLGQTKVFAWCLHILHDDLSRPVHEHMSPLNIEGPMMVLINHVALLMTWGLVFPPLAVMACVAVWIRSFYLQLAIGRRLRLASETDVSQEVPTDVVDEENSPSETSRRVSSPIDLETALQECDKLVPLVRQSVVPIAVTSSFLCSLMVFDTLTNAVGPSSAAAGWVIVVLSAGPVSLYAVCRSLWSLQLSPSIERPPEPTPNVGRKSEMEFVVRNPIRASFPS